MFCVALLATLASASGFRYDQWTQSMLCLVSESSTIPTACHLVQAYIDAWDDKKAALEAGYKVTFGENWEEMKMFWDPTEVYGDVVIATADNLTDALEEITSGYSLAVVAYTDWQDTPIDFTELGRRCIIAISDVSTAGTVAKTLSSVEEMTKQLGALRFEAARKQMTPEQFVGASQEIMNQNLGVKATATNKVKLTCKDGDLTEKVDYLLINAELKMDKKCKIPAIGITEYGKFNDKDHAKKLEANYCLMSDTKWVKSHKNDDKFYNCKDVGLIYQYNTAAFVFKDDGVYMNGQRWTRYDWFSGKLSGLASVLDGAAYVSLALDSTFPESNPPITHFNVSVQTMVDYAIELMPKSGFMDRLIAASYLEWKAANALDPQLMIQFDHTNPKWNGWHVIGEAKKKESVQVQQVPPGLTFEAKSITERPIGEGSLEEDWEPLGAGIIVVIVIAVIIVILLIVVVVMWFKCRPTLAALLLKVGITIPVGDDDKKEDAAEA